MMAEKKVISLKLLIDAQAKRVLFAESGKEFVDFLFHIMSLPIGTVVKLLNVKGMVGSLGALYKSIDSLSSEFFQADISKDSVLKPRAPLNVPLLSVDYHAPVSDSTKVYWCSTRDHGYITRCRGTACPSCRCGMYTECIWVTETAGSAAGESSSGEHEAAGYVKGVVTYMVMDNLEVKPMSTISGITLINKFHVKNVSSLVEKEVEVGLKEGLAMLKASLETKAVLTTVFVANK